MMHVHAGMNVWNSAVRRYHQWRLETSHVNMTILALVFAGLTGMGAFLRVYTPYSPVPFTAQTFFVLLSGVMLGKHWGAASQSLYIAIGAAGMPWFAGGNAGVDVLFGATGGYLVGFVLASEALGYAVDGRAVAGSVSSLVGTMFVASLAILACGTLGLVALGFTPAQALLYGFLPFLGAEAVKAALAGGAAVYLTPSGAIRA
ncbi:MAG: biotin transporter BioY [Thermoplasmata archaeon]|nr:biotin transporter BioY [Thermoplasmata archaeon]